MASGTSCGAQDRQPVTYVPGLNCHLCLRTVPDGALTSPCSGPVRAGFARPHGPLNESLGRAWDPEACFHEQLFFSSFVGTLAALIVRALERITLEGHPTEKGKELWQ